MKRIIEWITKSPKTAYLCVISLLLLSTIFSIVRFIKPNNKDVLKEQDVPIMISKNNSDKKETIAEKKMKLEWITSELESYQEKINSSMLDKTDSTRIEKLYNEYLRLKNGD